VSLRSQHPKGFSGWVHWRAHHRQLDGQEHIAHQRRAALIRIFTGLSRVIVWLTLILLYALGVSFTKSLFTSVAFVAIISLYANAATDWGQVAASLAQLTAGDAHHDAEAARVAIGVDYAQIEQDIARLALLQPCPEADELAQSIRTKLGGSS
jgi:hypothetical protein